MWWKTTFRRSRKRGGPATVGQTMLDEAFLRRLERLALNASRTLRGGLSGTHPSTRRLPAPTFSDHRSYTAGDDLRYVDWNAYGRQEELFVKLGETEQDVPVHVLLDRSRSMDFGANDTHKLQFGRMLLATLGYLALASGDKLSVAAFDAQLAPVFGPQQSKAHALPLLRYASSVTPGAASEIGPAIQHYIRQRSGGLLVVISDLWAVGDIDAVLRSVQPPRWQLLLLHVLHPDEIKPPISGDIELEDSEHGDAIALTADAATMARYGERFNQWCGAIETACGRRGATYARIATDMPLEQAVIPFLRQRLILRSA
ncbi:MAG: DUF58 domain-containing protein [Chloroflexota bacterium]|nr:DUF58 domain-containing protein [Chloroflexota bacterium]